MGALEAYLLTSILTYLTKQIPLSTEHIIVLVITIVVVRVQTYMINQHVCTEFNHEGFVWLIGVVNLT